MKKNRYLKIIVSSVALASSLYASDTEQIKDLTQMQNFYYDKGYRVGSEKFYKKGYEQAILDMVQQMKQYKQTIDAYEAGKYYMKNNKITYPKVYRYRDGDGQYKIQIDPPEVKSKLTLEDIFMLPELSKNANLSYQNNQLLNSDAKNVMYGNSFGSVNEAGVKNTSPIAILQEFGIDFPKTPRIKKLLEKNNIKYVQTPSSYKGYFSSKNNFQTFCRTNTGDSRCRNLFRK